MITIDSSGINLANVRALIDKFVAKEVERISLATFREVMKVYPYYTGTFASNWIIEVGTKYTTPSNTAPEYKGGKASVHYLAATPPSSLPSIYANPYIPVYIINATPYAMMIEYEGTPRHASPWMIANHARNTIAFTFN